MIDTNPSADNSAQEGFQAQSVQILGKVVCLKQFKQGHCQHLTDEPKLIGFESLKRETMELVMVDQFFETGFNRLSLMIKVIELDRSLRRAILLFMRASQNQPTKGQLSGISAKRLLRA